MHSHAKESVRRAMILTAAAATAPAEREPAAGVENIEAGVTLHRLRSNAPPFA